MKLQRHNATSIAGSNCGIYSTVTIESIRLHRLRAHNPHFRVRLHTSMHDFRRSLWLTIASIAILQSLSPACAGQGARGNRGASVSRTVTAVRTTQPPNLHGYLDRTWSHAGLITTFRQQFPHEGTRPTQRTEVRILYDSKNLYLGVHCFDSSPKQIVATELQRDGNFATDDYVSFLISPNNDGRSGYIFTINPLGTQFDSYISQEGVLLDTNWDGIWHSDAHITQDGWTATVAIPFAIMNFKSSSDATVGFNVLRFVRRDNETDLWQGWKIIYGLDRISEAGQIDGLKNIGSGRLVLFQPFALTGFITNPKGNLPGQNNSGSTSGSNAQAQGTAGFNFKYGIRSDLVANATVNPDFSDTPVDPQRFNTTPYPETLPETRPFFLENEGVFQFGTHDTSQLFFSRNIGIDPATGLQFPVDAGGKITGAVGPFDLGMLDVQTGQASFTKPTNYAVGRLKWRVLSESYLGAIFTDKESDNTSDPYNRVFGADANFIFWRELTLNGYVARSESSQSVLKGKNVAYSGNLNFTNNWIEAELERSRVDANFNPEIGFVNRTDLVTDFSSLDLIRRPKSGPIREYDVAGFIYYQPSTEGILQTQEWQNTFRIYFQNGAYSDDDIVDNFIQRLSQPFNIFKNVYIPAGEYHYNRHQLTYNSNQDKKYFYKLYERFGSYYDGSMSQTGVVGSWHPDAHIFTNDSEMWYRFKLPTGRYNVLVASYQAGYSFNRFITLSALAQQNSTQQFPWSTNVRFQYEYKPDSFLYVIYNKGSQFNSIEGGNPSLPSQSTFTIKLTHSFLR
ncbi:MAG: carbohydrate binding family 9 domain-containing protein [Acidobacteriaceae bacterium]